MTADHVLAPAAILIVDDNSVNRLMLTRHVERLGLTAAVAEDGREALDKLAAAPYDLVLLDVMMPEPDGYEVLEQIKTNPALQHIPVLMITGLEEAESLDRCLALGAEGFLTKPFNGAALREKITASLERRRQ